MSESDTERTETLRGAVEVWGEDLQVDIAIEELSELTTELARRQRGRERPSAIVEEIADAQLCLDQLKLMYGRQQVAEAERQKLDRLEERVEADRPALADGEIVPREDLEKTADNEDGTHYRCPRCDYEFVHEHCDCPECGWAGMCQGGGSA